MDNASLTQWNRLEARPRKDDFSKTLRAELRDPLWMMTRQWQLGEFTAKDVGSPVSAKIFYRNTFLNKVKLGENEVDQLNRELPLETLVERKNIQTTKRNGEDFINNLTLGNAFRRRLIAFIKSVFTHPLEKQILKTLNEHPQLQFDLPTANEDPHSFENVSLKTNSKLHQMHAAHGPRVLHGGKLYASLNSGVNLSSYFVNLGTTDKNKLDHLGVKAVNWFNALFNQLGANEHSSWHSNHMEYQFSVAAQDKDHSSLILSSKEYPGGRLDWFSSDFNSDSEGDFTQDAESSLNVEEYDEVFPSEIELPGWPVKRFWEIEGQNLNFCQIQPNKTDLAKLLFTEFGLLFSNNWFIMPLTLPFGSLTKIEHIEVKDTFGQYTLSKQYENYAENNNWKLFSLADSKDNNLSTQYLYLPPVAHDIMISEPLEKVNFVRDEMANMVWAIEVTIPDGMGSSLDGHTMAMKVRELYRSLSDTANGEENNNENNKAQIKYSLVSEVPENWIPFIPIKRQDGNQLSRQIQLQRAQLPRIVEKLNPMHIEPRTDLLLKEPSPHYIFQQEVPKSGTILELHWQRTRMANGKNVIWLGRSKTNGRGEASSALQYDRVKPS